MSDGNDFANRDRLLRVVDRVVATGAIDVVDGRALRAAVEDGLRSRDLLASRGAWLNLAIEPKVDADPRLPQIDRARITIVADPETLIAGEFESRAMKSWVNRWADLGLSEE